MLKKVLVGTMAAVMTVAAAGNVSVVKAEEKTREDLTIGISWRTMQEERYVTELNEMQKICDEQGVTLLSQCAENDIQKQVGQIENLISQDVDILIVLASEKGAVDNVLKDAHDAGIYVCYYEQVNSETYCDMSGGNDYFEVGQAITKTIGDMDVTGDICYLYGDSAGGTGLVMFAEGMQDSMKDCDVNVVGEQYVQNWDPALGMGYVENWISEYGDSISAVLCMNDGLAGGAVQALENEGLAGKVLVSGQDCDLAACRRIVEGTQTCSVLKGGAEYANQFINTVIDAYLGEITEEDFDATDTNSVGETIPFMSYPAIIVTKDNLDEIIIDGGIYTYDEVYGDEEVVEAE